MNGFTDQFALLGRIAPRGARQNDDKFLPSVARQKIITAHHLSERFRHRQENTIAHRMPIGVIDGFEIIDIQDQDGEILAMQQVAFHQRLQVVVKGPAVIDPGQSVALGFFLGHFQFLAQALHLARQALDSGLFADLLVAHSFPKCCDLDFKRRFHFSNVVEPGNLFHFFALPQDFLMIGVVFGIHRNHGPGQQVDNIAQLGFTFIQIFFLFVDKAGNDRFLFLKVGQDAFRFLLGEEFLAECVHGGIKPICF